MPLGPIARALLLPMEIQPVAPFTLGPQVTTETV